MVVGETREPDAHRSVGKDSGLQSPGIGDAGAGRGLPAGGPTEGRKDIRNGLHAGQGQAEAIPFVGKAGEHPGAARLTKRDAASEGTSAIDIDVHFFGAERFPGGVEEGVDNLFSSKSAWSW